MSTTVVGSSINRKDGELKVTGQVRYAADHPLEHVAHAVAICSTIANSRVSHIDSSAAERAPGFLAIIHHGNAPRLFRPVNNFESASKPGEIRVVFADERLHYAGQYIAVVVADTLQQAQRAAELVQVTYETWSPVIDTDNAMDTVYNPAEFFGEKLAARRGDPESAFHAAEVRHEADYVTPIEHHNPMEPSASIAHWDSNELTLYETTQWVVGARNTVAETLGMPEENVHIISPFIGGGFGCTGFIWPHSVRSAIAAKKVDRPAATRVSANRKPSRHNSFIGKPNAMGQELYPRGSSVDSAYSLDVTPGNHAAPTVGISLRDRFSN